MLDVPFVTKGPQDTNDSLIRKFSKKVITSGLLTDIKRKDRYEKPSTQKKKKYAEFKRLKKRAIKLRARKP